MKNKNFFVILLLSLFFSGLKLHAQIAINADGSSPDVSAMLEITSSEKGILIPRMTTAERAAIGSPATGLMVFDNSENSFWFYDGSDWQIIGTTDVVRDADNDTKIQVEESADEDIIRFEVAGENTMMIDSTGYVGIGTVPNDRFQVKTGLSTISTISASNEGYGVYALTFADWQSYTATVSGELEKIELKSEYATGIRTVNFYEGEGTSGTLLGTETFDPNSTLGWIEIPFTDIPQEAGQKYTIAFDNRSYLNTRFFDSYSGGRSGLDPDRDYAFKVHVYADILFSVGDSSITIGEFELPNDDGDNGQTLITDGAGNVGWADLSSYVNNTDEQTIDVLNLNGSNLEISLQDDGEASKTLDLSSINTDNQQIDVLNLNGSILELSLQDDGETTKTLDLSSLILIGTIQMWPSSTPPSGWLICDGSTFNPSTYAELNIVLGGNTLPNFSGRFPLGVGNSGTSGSTSHSISSTGGEETHLLTINEMPSHAHGISYQGRSKSGSGGEVSDLDASGDTATTDSTGGGQAHNNMPPFYTVNFIIKAE